MRITRDGRSCHGLLTLCVDGQVQVKDLRSTAPDWLDDRPTVSLEAICQREWFKDKWELVAVNIQTKQVRPLEPNIDQKLRKGATVIYGGAGVWAAQTTDGVRSNVHPFKPKAGLWGVGKDGTLGYCRRQQEGLGIVFRAIDGTEMETDAKTPMRDVHVLAFGIAAYVSGNKLHTVGTPAPVTVPEEIFEPRLLQLTDGNYAVVYHTQDRLLLQPKIGIADGHVIWNTSGTFSPDLTEIRPQVIRVVWSATKAEGPDQFRTTAPLDIDLNTPSVPLTRPKVETLPFPLWDGYFFAYSKRYGINATAPGNCTVIVESGLNPLTPVIIGDRSDDDVDLIEEWKDPQRWSRVVAVYVASEDKPGLLAARVNTAKRRMGVLGLSARPVLVYTPSEPALDVGADWVGISCYPDPGETVAQAETRWRNMMQKAHGHSTALICGAYDRRKFIWGPGLIDNRVLLDCQARYPELARSAGAWCKALLWFSDGRPGGTRDHEEIRPWHVATSAAIAFPSLVPDRPLVTISSYEPKEGQAPLKVKAVRTLSGGPASRLYWMMRVHGKVMWITVASNPATDPDHHFVFEEPGVYEIAVEVTGPGGSDRTGAVRLVTVT